MSSNSGQTDHIPYAVVPLIGIVAACGVVLICWVFYRHSSEPQPEIREMTDEQAMYMREVRHVLSTLNDECTEHARNVGSTA